MKKHWKIAVIGLIAVALIAGGIFAFYQIQNQIYINKVEQYEKEHYEPYLEAKYPVEEGRTETLDETLERAELHTRAAAIVAGRATEDDFEPLDYGNEALPAVAVEDSEEFYGDGSNLVEFGHDVSIDLIKSYLDEATENYEYVFAIKKENGMFTVLRPHSNNMIKRIDDENIIFQPEDEVEFNPDKEELVYFSKEKHGFSALLLNDMKYVFPAVFVRNGGFKTGEIRLDWDEDPISHRYIDGSEPITYDIIKDLRDITLNGVPLESAGLFTFLRDKYYDPVSKSKTNSEGDHAEYYAECSSMEPVELAGEYGTNRFSATFQPMIYCNNRLDDHYVIDSTNLDTEVTDMGYAVIDIKSYLSSLSADDLDGLYMPDTPNAKRLFIDWSILKLVK